MTQLVAIVSDLVAESVELDDLVAELDDAAWSKPTPAPGWTIAHQIAHLRWADLAALKAIHRPEEFMSWIADIPAGRDAVPAVVNAGADELAASAPADLLAAWRSDRARLAAALVEVDPGKQLPWLGPPMSPASMASARLMETWAHGLDVADALGLSRHATDRARHVAHIGVRARAFAFRVNGREVPEAEVCVELTAPSGGSWTWGDQDAPERVSGPAVDFCMLVTQRRHRDDLDLVADGAGADAWLDIAQAFAGPPGAGRASLRG